MTDAFRIEVEQWLHGAAGDAHERQTLAAIRIQVGDLCITRVEDLAAKTVREGAHLSAYRLAYWLAEHWWRLRWEPEVGGEAIDWLMSHRLGAAGAGFIWPPLTLTSDGETIRLTQRARPDPRRIGRIRYLETLDTLVSSTDFEQGVDAFLTTVLARLTTLGLGGTDLELLWTEVTRERRDPALTEVRRLEALLGIDPDEAEEGLMQQVSDYGRTFGAGAAREIAAAAREGFLQAAHAAESQRAQASTRIDLAERYTLTQRLQQLRAAATPAWQLGEALAHHARALWHLSNDPLTNRRLAEIANAPVDFLTQP